MPETYQAERTSAKADIEAAGCPCKVVTRATPGTFTETGAIIDEFSFIERLGGTVVDGDFKFIIPALGNPDPLDPDIYDIVVDTTDTLYASAVGTYQIVDPGTFNPGGVAILHNVHARRR
jgi:hypothetical protein